MKIGIDLIPPKEGYFISVETSETESICFNNTFDNNEIKKQKLVGERYSNEDPRDSWVTLDVVDGEPVEKREVEWIDEGDIAIINNKAWKTVERVDMPREIHDKLVDLTSRIYMNREELDSVKRELEELDKFLSERMDELMAKFSE